MRRITSGLLSIVGHMYIGIDIGTSSIKALLVDDDQTIVGESAQALTVSRPREQWSEQDPLDWWAGLRWIMLDLKGNHPVEMSAVRGIGLSGQMHGATLLDPAGDPLRPCILWDDGRSHEQCTELERLCPQSRSITGNIAMPGFTAPKLLWVRDHEPETFKRVRKVLLPKDFVRLKLTGEYISDCSDSAGTLWLDCAARQWSETLLEACGLDLDQMPSLVEGCAPGGELRPELAREWGMKHPVTVAGGAGDNAASACGIGAINDGDAFVSVGTSGVLFVSGESFCPNTEGAVHTFCHALPETWHQMGVILSAASCFNWLAGLTGVPVGALFDDLDSAKDSDPKLFFLPYLSGERTPHNDASLRAVFAGMSNSTARADLAAAVARGIGFAFRDCLKELRTAGAQVERLLAVGGASRSDAFLQILADILEVPIERPAAAETGAAFGAARLGMAAVHEGEHAAIMTRVAVTRSFEPNPACREQNTESWTRFRALLTAAKQKSTE